MARNRGATSLKCRRRRQDPMRDYDRLHPDLRDWLASAVLPWSPRSAKRAFERAVAKACTPNDALREMDRLQARLIARDARRVWGPDHPTAALETDR